MPADRFIHPRMGHSDKVNLLTDLEFRVWVHYLLAADDFGVMRRSAVTLQALCDSLSNRPKKVIDRCLDALVSCGLLLPFEHQGRPYVCQWDWQSFQKIEYPRPTLEPKPTEDVLVRCNDKTQELFAKHPGGVTKRTPKAPQSVPENSETGSREIPDYACGRVREEAKANGSRLVAYGSEGVQGEPTARSKRPIFTGQKLTVFEWQLDDCARTLGEFVDTFDLHDWFFTLDAQAMRANLVIPKRDGGEWLQAQLVAEAQRRGLPLQMATMPQMGKGTTRLAAAVANIKAREAV